MKKTGRLLAILIMTMMVSTPFMSFATEEAVVDVSETADVVVSEETAEDPEAVKPEETADTEKTADEAAAAEEVAHTEVVETEQTGTTETDAPEVETTKVTVAKSIEDLAKKSVAARDNEAFFSIDASKKKTSADLATDEIRQEVKDILKSNESTSDKQTEIAELLQDSGYYSTTETGKAKVDVISDYALQRIRLVADKEKEINAYGAIKAVYYNGYYFLSYDSIEATKRAYETLSGEYGKGSVLIDAPIKLEDNSFSHGWGTAYMGMREEKTDAQVDGCVKVAVIDTGISKNHEVFAGHPIVDEKGFVKGSDSCYDDNGHGTAVAGIIAESTPANVSIMPVKVLDSNGHGGIFDILLGLNYAYEKQADFINMSLGGYLNEDEFNKINKEIGDLEVKYNHQAMIICAAGNDNRNLDASGVHEFPAEMNRTIAVASFDTKNQKSSFSNYGKCIDYTAPGSSIEVASLDESDPYKRGSGTSYSCPYVVSAAALIKARDTSLTNMQIENILTEKSVDVEMGDAGKDVIFGSGCPHFTDIDKVHGSGRITEYAYCLGIEDKGYTGSAITQELSLIARGELLKEDRDYTITYRNNVNVGTAEMVINGKGSYAGTIKGIKFKIVQGKTAPTFELAKTVLAYTGGGITPEVKNVRVNGVALSSDEYGVSYSNNVYPGRGTVTVKCKGNYSGSASKGFNIIGNIANTAVSVGSGDYTGGAITPGVGVSFAGRQLGNGSDYTVSYSNNVYIGTGYATITGRGYYSGSVTVPFRIGPKGTACKKMTRAKKSVTVKWARQKSKMPKGRISGYQIQLSQDPGFGYDVRTYNVKGYKKTSKKVSKLARKTTYYARVRTYVKSGGDYYFSGWSNVRAAKTK